MDICIRGINESIIKSLDQSASKRGMSREEYLRQCLERIAYDDRALESRYVQQLQKLTFCIQTQQQQMNELINQMFELENVVITGEVKPLVQRENLQLTLNIQREENREHGGENTKNHSLV